MNIKKHDILLVDFPFSNLKDTKVRPALVLKVLEGHNIILCQITTKKQMFEDYVVSLSRNDCSGDIRFDSYINADMIFTLDESLVRGKLGFVKSSQIITKINSNLKFLFFN